MEALHVALSDAGFSSGGASSDVGETFGVEVQGGSIRYFESSHSFRATCKNPAHRFDGHECQLSRTSHAFRSSCNGRPLGALLAWLHLNDHKECQFRHDHRCSNFIIHLPFELRNRLRNELKASDAGLKLLSYERDRVGGESEEPLHVPMGW